LPTNIEVTASKIKPKNNNLALLFEMAPLANGLVIFSGCFLSDSMSK